MYLIMTIWNGWLAVKLIIETTKSESIWMCWFEPDQRQAWVLMVNLDPFLMIMYVIYVIVAVSHDDMFRKLELRNVELHEYYRMIHCCSNGIINGCRSSWRNEYDGMREKKTARSNSHRSHCCFDRLYMIHLDRMTRDRRVWFYSVCVFERKRDWWQWSKRRAN